MEKHYIIDLAGNPKSPILIVWVSHRGKDSLRVLKIKDVGRFNIKESSLITPQDIESFAFPYLCSNELFSLVIGTTDKYLRYVISGYNISNSIGHICYYEFALDFVKKLINKMLAVNARFYLSSPERKIEILLKKEYFPKLEKIRMQNKLKS
jgi:hypothetical protein